MERSFLHNWRTRLTPSSRLRFSELTMTDHDSLDPIRLELPDHETCRDVPLPVLDGKEPGRWSCSLLPSVSLAALLHGVLIFFALTLVMNVTLSDSVISISLFPGGPVGGSGPGLKPGPPPLPADDEVASAGPALPKAAAAVQKPRKQNPPAPPARSQNIEAVRLPKREAVLPREREQQSSNLEHDTPDQVLPAEEPAALNGAATREDGSDGATAPAVHSTTTSGHGSGSGGYAGGGKNGGDGGGSGLVAARFGDADGPRFVQRVMPKYPEQARRKGREGRVVLRLIIGPQGELKDVRVVEGSGHGFEEAALAAARASVYAPAMRSGQGVECAALLPIRFALKGS